MSRRVKLGDGIRVELSNGGTVVFDGDDPADVRVVSHAHGDHLVEAPSFVASELTGALASVRQESEPTVVDHPAVDLVSAGHIAGSRAAKVTDPDTGRTYLYTGDCSTRDRFYLAGFDPPSADVLVMESTYGEPEYEFPPTEEVVAEVREWLAETNDEVVVLFGYALGRAQKLQRILADSPRERVFVTDAVADLNAMIADHLDVSFPAERYGSDVDLQPGDALVLPMSTSRLAWIESLIDAHDAVTAGFSGWATDDSFIYRRGVDEGFVLSDHCDFNGLIEVVEAVDPERVYLQHGSAATFASHLTTELGYDAQALKEHQSTLGDF